MSALEIFLVITAYLLGSVMGALIVNQVMDLTDPRELGSHNPGTANMLRNHGRWPAIWTLLIDVSKGVIVVGATMYLSSDQLIIGAVTIAVCLGHMFPVFYGFSGGKGVATALGVITLLSGQLASGLVGIWIIAFGLSGYSSVASLLCAICTPLLAFYLIPEYGLTLSVLALMIVFQHRDNIRNLRRGAELRFRRHK